MDGVRRHAQDRALREESAADGEPALWHFPGQTDAQRRVDAERLVDDGLEVGQPLDLLKRRDLVLVRGVRVGGAERGVELGLELALRCLVLGEPVGDRTRGAAVEYSTLRVKD